MSQIAYPTNHKFFEPARCKEGFSKCPRLNVPLQSIYFFKPALSNVKCTVNSAAQSRPARIFIFHTSSLGDWKLCLQSVSSLSWTIQYSLGIPECSTREGLHLPRSVRGLVLYVRRGLSDVITSGGQKHRKRWRHQGECTFIYPLSALNSYGPNSSLSGEMSRVIFFIFYFQSLYILGV